MAAPDKSPGKLVGDDAMLQVIARGHSSQTVVGSSVSQSQQGSAEGTAPKAAFDLPAELSALTEYRIIKELGRGGMGVVYLAEHTLTGRKEVLKVLNELLMGHSEARKRFEREVKCIASVNHGAIVRCYTVRMMPRTIVLAMEYVPGCDLHQFIARNGRLPQHVACGIATEVCSGLQHAMDAGLIHRDIKPSNIMVYKADGRLRAKILDFGLARLVESDAGPGLTREGSMLGTLDYISPEQSMDANKADIRSDIYSLGCTLYHMLVGHPPFSGSQGELIMAHSQQIPPTVNLIHPELPVALADVVARMMAKEPSRRYATPRDVAEALKPFLSRKRGETTAHDLSSTDAPETHRVIAAELDTSVEVGSAKKLPTVTAATGSQRLFETDRPDGEQRDAQAPKALVVAQLVPSRSSDRQRKPQSLLPAVALGLVASLAFVGGILGIIPIRTPNGTIVIENSPAEAISRDSTADQTEVEAVALDAVSKSIVGVLRPGQVWKGVTYWKQGPQLAEAPSGATYELSISDVDHVNGTFVASYRWDDAPSGNPDVGETWETLGTVAGNQATWRTGDIYVGNHSGILFDDRIEVTLNLPRSQGVAILRPEKGNEVDNDTTQVRADDLAHDLQGSKVVEQRELPRPPFAIAPFTAEQARAHQQAWAEYLGVAPMQPNSIGVKMAVIPPGEFQMGSSDADIAYAMTFARGSAQFFANERPQHLVRITRPFRLGIHEVTVDQFERFVLQTGYKTQAEEFEAESDAGKLDDSNLSEANAKATWRTPGYDVTDDSPVTNVSWNDAVAFCNWLSEGEKLQPSYIRDGASWMLVAQPQGYRLPTEAEWEYACRAGTTTQYWFGNDWRELEKFGWAGANAKGRPQAVGLLPANPFGLFDVHGNVYEWCHDGYETNWYAISPTDDPEGPKGSPGRVARGGTWRGWPEASRSSSRHLNGTSEYRFYDRGFRIAL